MRERETKKGPVHQTRAQYKVLSRSHSAPLPIQRRDDPEHVHKRAPDRPCVCGEIRAQQCAGAPRVLVDQREADRADRTFGTELLVFENGRARAFTTNYGASFAGVWHSVVYNFKL